MNDWVMVIQTVLHPPCQKEETSMSVRHIYGPTYRWYGMAWHGTCR